LRSHEGPGHANAATVRKRSTWTKGLPGLNACPNVGDDIRRHVDTAYPARRATPLYRQEPCVLAFENSLSSILPIDRTPGPVDPPEKAQMFPLELNIDRVSSLNGMKRLTVPSYDWILAHRANPYPPVRYLAEPGYAISKVRLARSNDPLVLRHEEVELAVGTCGPPKLDHASQVLLHEPIDENGAPGLWEATTGYRATVRQEGGPFTERSGFDIYDLGAFSMQADGSASATLWSVDADANLVAPNVGGGRHYASCGELSWDHLQVHSRIDLADASAAGIAVGVGHGTPVPQAVLATVEPDGGGHSLIVRIRDGADERELGRAAVTLSGPFLLSVVAYDDLVRASVGPVSVDGPRGAVLEGRVALVAAGEAKFAGISVAALDIYSFDFLTSKYASFGEHVDSYDGSLPTLAAGALGGTPTPIAAILASNALELAQVMAATADPQERQRLFDTIVSALGIGVRQDSTAVTITRLTDAGGTFGHLCESPEPISVIRDVTVRLTKHVRVWVPGPLSLAPPVPPLTPEAIAAEALTLRTPIDSDPLQEALANVTFGEQKVTVSEASSAFSPQDQIARVVATPQGDQVELYDVPASSPAGAAVGALRRTMTLAEAALRPGYAAVARLTPGSIAVVKPGGVIGPIMYGHWEDEEIAVAVTTLTNGDETKILLLSGTPLTAGKHTLYLILDRGRWSISTGSGPEQHYHDERAIPLEW
jgi:hypothetical protein